MFGSNVLTRPWTELVFYDSKLRECCEPIGENEHFWGYTNLRTMVEACSALLERKKLEHRTTRMMDERIGQAVRQYTQQSQDQGNASQDLITYSSQATAGNSSRSFQDRRHVTWCFAAPPTNTNPQKRMQDADWPQRKGKTDTLPYSMEHGSATHTTTLVDANPKENVSRASTCVAPAAPPAMARTLAQPKPPWGVKTPLRLDRWRYFLDRLDNGQLTEAHLHVLNSIAKGFSYHSHKIIKKKNLYL
jgi:hypothetical protein